MYFRCFFRYCGSRGKPHSFTTTLKGTPFLSHGGVARLRSGGDKKNRRTIERRLRLGKSVWLKQFWASSASTYMLSMAIFQNISLKSVYPARYRHLDTNGRAYLRDHHQCGIFPFQKTIPHQIFIHLSGAFAAFADGPYH